MKVNVCGSAQHEWLNGELFVLPDVFTSEKMAYLSSEAVEAIRANKPADVSDQFPMFAIDRTESGDKLYEVLETVVFAGGCMQCFIFPVVKTLL